MSLKADLHDYLATHAITEHTADRIYPGIAPQDDDLAGGRAGGKQLAYITYTRFANQAEHHLRAASGLATATFQLDFWAVDTVALEAMAEQARDQLDGFRGFMGNTDVRHIKLEELDGVEPPTTGAETPVHRTTHTLTIRHVQSVPSIAEGINT